VFIATHIPYDSNLEIFQERIEFLHHIGYQGAIIDIPSIETLKEFKINCYPNQKSPKITPPINIVSLLAYKGENFSIPLVPCITIQPKNESELKQRLQIITQSRILITVQSANKEVLEVAARDGRVDILAMPTLECQKTLTKGIFSLAQQNNCNIELSFTPFLEAEHHARTKIMRMLYRLFLMAKPLSHSYLIGAFTADNWLYRGPHESEAILESIFEIAEPFAQKIIKDNVEAMILRYIKRDQGLFIEPDVEIVGERPCTDEEKLDLTNDQLKTQ
jgi:RNase P/RNase MRP subunit p30